MDNQIQKILDELYAIDPDLKKNEDKLIRIINELLESRPSAEIDDEFVRELRSRLLARAGEIQAVGRQGTGFMFNLMGANKFAFAFGAMAIVLLLIITPLAFFSGEKANQGVNLTLNSGVKPLPENAFGKITLDAAAPQGMGGMEESMAADNPTLAYGRGGGGAAPLAADGDAKMIMPEFINYNYVYKGEEFSVGEDKMNVYRRSDLGGAGEFARMLSQIKLDLIDLSKFSLAKVTSLNLNEEKDFGYSIYLNFQENSLSLYKNWSKWPMEAGEGASHWGIEDIPADNELISIASRFLEEYGISTANYGPAEVQNNWRKAYEMAEDKVNSYVPQELTVIYPQIIEGKTVYDQGGNKTGLYVGVDGKNKKVASIGQIRAHSFESSMYGVETDASKILELAQNGGSNNYLYKHDNPTRTIDIELGTPELKLVQFWKYNQDKQMGEELYIPSYVFPIISKSEESMYMFSENVVVPLVQELVETYGGRIGIPEPMPMVTEDEAETSAGDGAGSEPALPETPAARDEVMIQVE